MAIYGRVGRGDAVPVRLCSRADRRSREEGSVTDMTIAVLLAWAFGTGVFLYGWFFLARPEDRRSGRKK
mgnify:CR=1 FL=1